MSAFTNVPLGNVATLRAGVGFPVDMQGKKTGDYPLAKVGDISRVGRSGSAIISSADHYVDKCDLEILRAKPIPEGSVLFAKIGEAMKHNHRVIAGCNMLVDNNAMAAIPSNRITSRYLYHLLRTIDFYRLASSTTVPALRKSELEKVNVPLPPLEEQRRIAGILDKAEAFRTKRRAALDLLDSLSQSIFLEMFGDPVTNPMGWEAKSVAEICKRVTVGVVVKPASYYCEIGVPALRSLNVRATGIQTNDLVFFSDRDNESTLSKSRIWKDDILLVRSGQPGTAAIVPESLNGANAIDLLIVTPNQEAVLPIYMCQFFNSNRGRALVLGQQRGQVQKHLNVGSLKEFDLLLPPMKLQQQFTSRIQSVEKLKAAHRKSLAELDALFVSLQDRAFKGEL